MPSKTYDLLTLRTTIAAPGDYVAAYPAGGPLYAISFANLATAVSGQLGLGTAATRNVGTAAGTVAAGNDSRITGALQTSGGTLTGELVTAASAGASAGLNLPHGAAPSAPANGDLWTTTAGLYARINGGTVGPMGAGGGGGGIQSSVLMFGDGSDGNVTVSSGTTTLSRDMFYNNLTLSGTGVINTNGFRIYVAGTLDITAAGVGAIANNAGNGGAASAGTGGSGGAGGAGGNIGFGSYSLQAGQTAQAGVGGATSTGATGSGSGTYGGASPGGAGAGGVGTHPGGAAGSINSSYGYLPAIPFPFPGTSVPAGGWPGAGAYLVTSAFGPTGGAGGGDGTNQGGSSGGGGGGGGIIYICANTINRGASTAASAIQDKGGAAGTGFAPVAGNCGGAGGSGGGTGGWVIIIVGVLTGATAPNCIDVSGGNGAAGTNASGTGAGGDGGAAGGSGRVHIYNLTAGSVTTQAPTSSVTGSTHSGASGGAGGTAATTRVSL